jgi:hypothetical protein
LPTGDVQVHLHHSARYTHEDHDLRSLNVSPAPVQLVQTANNSRCKRACSTPSLPSQAD